MNQKYNQDLALGTYLREHKSFLLDERVQAVMKTLPDSTYCESLEEICARCPTHGPTKATAVTDDLFSYAYVIKSYGIDRVYVQRCEQCKRIVITPMSEQCNWCGHEWRGKNPLRMVWEQIKAAEQRVQNDRSNPAEQDAIGAVQNTDVNLNQSVTEKKPNPRIRTQNTGYSLHAEDQSEVDRYWDMLEERGEGDVRHYLLKELSEFKEASKHYPRKPWGSDQFGLFLCSFEHHFRDQGIIERYYNNNLDNMRINFSLSARSGFLEKIGMKQYPDEYDCAHVFNMTKAALCGDWQVIERFLQARPGPPKVGHRETRLLCNAMYVALGHQVSEKMLLELRTAKASKYFRAHIDASIAICDRSPDRLAIALKNIIKLNKKQQNTFPLERTICIPAHAFHNIWIRSGGYSISNKLKGYLWDDVIDAAFANNSQPIQHDLDDINPILHRWYNDLPDSIDDLELLASIEAPSK